MIWRARKDFVGKPSARSYRSPDQRYGQEALGSLAWAERVVCGQLILRQLDRAPRIQQELRKYGPEGTVRLCSARALGIYELVLGVVAVALIALGEALAGWPLMILVWLLCALSIMRLISAGKAGKRWRSAGSERPVQ
jgi:hypothetical protein